MYTTLLLIITVLLILFSINLYKNKKSNEQLPTQSSSATQVSDCGVNNTSKVNEHTDNMFITENDLPDTNTKIYGKKVNYIGGTDVYSSLPVSMDKTGFYAYEDGCSSCKKYALGWRCKAHRYNNTQNVSLQPEGTVDLCKNYTNYTPLMYDGVRKIDNRIMA
tara:strand:- start:16 stop:504 length:489 start_codon:yes stop_codon:yes gene_type:complete